MGGNLTTQTAEARFAAALVRRVQKFYELLNSEEFEKCFLMIDPALRDDPASITQLRYAASLKSFREWSGEITIREIRPLKININQPNRLYENRDFALAEVHWDDERG